MAYFSQKSLGYRHNFGMDVTKAHPFLPSKNKKKPQDNLQSVVVRHATIFLIQSVWIKRHNLQKVKRNSLQETQNGRFRFL